MKKEIKSFEQVEFTTELRNEDLEKLKGGISSGIDVAEGEEEESGHGTSACCITVW